MNLFHASKLGSFRGGFVIPANFYRPSGKRVVHFACSPLGACRWVRNPLATWSLYSIDASDIEGLEVNPNLPDSFMTSQRVSVKAFELVNTFNEDKGELLSCLRYLETLAD